jgi:hypothetical protein
LAHNKASFHEGKKSELVAKIEELESYLKDTEKVNNRELAALYKEKILECENFQRINKNLVYRLEVVQDQEKEKLKEVHIGKLTKDSCNKYNNYVDLLKVKV